MSEEEVFCPRRHEGPQFTSGPDHWQVRGGWTRHCSYCGGIHPDDAVRVIQAGGSCEATTKGYKRYLHGEGLDPCCKLYVMHFSLEQLNAFNDALAVRQRILEDGILPEDNTESNTNTPPPCQK